MAVFQARWCGAEVGVGDLGYAGRLVNLEVAQTWQDPAPLGHNRRAQMSVEAE